MVEHTGVCIINWHHYLRSVSVSPLYGFDLPCSYHMQSPRRTADSPNNTHMYRSTHRNPQSKEASHVCVMKKFRSLRCTACYHII